MWILSPHDIIAEMAGPWSLNLMCLKCTSNYINFCCILARIQQQPEGPEHLTERNNSFGYCVNPGNVYLLAFYGSAYQPSQVHGPLYCNFSGDPL